MIKTETFSFWEQIFWKGNRDTKKYEKSGDRSFWIPLTILTIFLVVHNFCLPLTTYLAAFPNFRQEL